MRLTWHSNLRKKQRSEADSIRHKSGIYLGAEALSRLGIKKHKNSGPYILNFKGKPEVRVYVGKKVITIINVKKMYYGEVEAIRAKNNIKK